MTCKEASEEASRAFSFPVTTVRNLRDEFDPYHDNRRRGWRNRPMMPSRVRVLDDLQDVREESLMVLVDQLLACNASVSDDAVEALAVVQRPIHNVAVRLLTGRRAEDYFLANTQELVQLDPGDLIDRRNAECGYDFGISGSDELAIEVKGLKRERGEILVTDREWSEARARG